MVQVSGSSAATKLIGRTKEIGIKMKYVQKTLTPHAVKAMVCSLVT